MRSRLALALFALAACTGSRLQLAAPLGAPLPVVVLDARPKVVSREFATSRVGTELTAPGVEQPKLTEDAVPLAHVLVNQLKTLLPNEAALLREREVLPSANDAVARAAAVPREADEAIGLLIVVHEWHALIAAGHRNLRHDVSLEVVDRTGRSVATSRSTGDGEVDNRDLQVNAEIFTRLLNDPPVAAMLSSQPAAPAP